MKTGGLVFVFFTVLLVNFILINCTGKTNNRSDVQKWSDYSGSKSCYSCHQDIYLAHIKSNHFLTSAKADTATVSGSYKEGHNFFFFDPITAVKIERRGDSLYQVAYKRGKEVVKRSIDITIGSGKRGQTYLYWKGSELFQLPVSYFHETGEWTNSPGFSNKVIFNRPVTARCLECHSTFFDSTGETSQGLTSFSRDNIIYGVDCEKCHGPGKEHVEFHIKNPQEKLAKFIINPSKLSRQLNLELCQMCHGGKMVQKVPSFNYLVGEPLSKYFGISNKPINVAETDVHGNQYGMMASSKCFQNSNMTCLSCHDAHANETKNESVFVARCKSCHTEAVNKCKLHSVIDENNLEQNCLNCHMPESESKAIMVLREGETVPTSAHMRSHFIRIDSAVASKIIKTIKSRK